MKRALIILALAALIAVVVLTAGYGWLFQSPSGRAFIKARLASELGALIGGEAEIGALKGLPPAHIILENVSLRDADGEWLLIPQATIDWLPFALLRGDVIINSASIDKARLTRAPRTETDEANQIRGFELPDRLPSITIDSLSINDLEYALESGDAPVRLDAAGLARMGGATLFIRFNANSDAEADTVSALIERRGDALSSNVTIASKETGLLAVLSNLGGALFIEAKGEGPLNAYRLDVDAALGAYGSMTGAIAGDLEKLDRLAINLDAALGARLANTAHLIGDTATIAANFTPTDNGGALDIERFQSAFGDVAGTLSWKNRRDALETVTIDAKAALAADWRPDLRRYIGDALAVKGEIGPSDGAYRASGLITASLVEGRFEDARTDLRDYFRGRADVVLKENESLPPAFKMGASASGDFDIAFEGAVKGAPVNVETLEGLSFSGDARYVFDSEEFSVKGDATLTPALAASIAPTIAFSRNASATVDLSGVADDFGGRIVATTPAARLGDATLPPMRITLAASDMPANSKGQISARAVDDSRRLIANFAQANNNAWRIAGLDYVGVEFAMKGSGSYDPLTGEGAVDLNYRGRDGAEPWPGIPLVGDFTAKGALRRGENNRIDVASSSLASKGWTAQGLTLAATGSPDRLQVTTNAALVALDKLAPVKEVTAVMAAEPRKGPRIALTAFDAKIEGAPLKVSEPAALVFGEGVTIEGLRARVGRNGSIAIDGAFSDRRWQGKIIANRAPIVSASSTVDFNFDLDTDRKTPARGDFTLTSQLSKTDAASLSGDFVWDGASVRVVDKKDKSVLDVDVQIPARLTRAPKLSVDMSGPFAGTARYEGRVETVASFLPAALQSLEGDLRFEGKAAGTLADPKLTGSLNVINGAFTELSTGLSIVNIDATARASAAANGSRIAFEAAGGGVSQKEKSITAKGFVLIGDATQLSSKFTMNNARLSAGPVSDVTASGEIDVSGPFTDLLAKGKFTIRNLDAQVITPEPTGLVDINVVAVNGDGEPAKQTTGVAPPASIRYDIEVEGDDRIFIRGRGLTSEWRAAVTVAGRAETPAIIGQMNLRKGDITFAGRRFDMTRGVITFDRLSLNNPILDLRAERETRSGVTASIVIAGRAEAPKITLESSPALPPEDIMALILFDKPASELSALESLQVAEGLAELGGIGPFGGNGVTGSARKALGLDLLNFDIDETDSAASTLTVGKYVADGLFVSATQDARGQNGSVRIEYEIGDSFTVETELRQDGDQTVSANWKRDF